MYEFALPKSDYSLPLQLGQQLDFCCLGSGDEICTGSFYPYEMESSGGSGSKGGVKIVVPNKDAEGNAALVGLGSSKFVSCHILLRCC